MSPYGSGTIPTCTFQGDIIMTHKQTADFLSVTNKALINSTNVLRAAVRSEHQKWPDGKVPYVISSDFASDERALIAKAMTEFHDKTCIQ